MIRTNLIRVLLATACGASVFSVSARTPITDMKQALRVALDSPVSGVFAGELADYARREFRSNDPVLADIQRVGSHKQPGCGRLRVSLSQANAQVPDAKGIYGKPSTQKVTFSMNICEDGSFPKGEEGQ